MTGKKTTEPKEKMAEFHRVGKLEAKGIIGDVLRNKIELDKVWDDFEEVAGAPTDSPLGNATWRAIDRLVEFASRLIGDETETLAWYIWDNSCGKKGHEHTLPNGKMKKIRTIDDLLLVLGY